MPVLRVVVPPPFQQPAVVDATPSAGPLEFLSPARSGTLRGRVELQTITNPVGRRTDRVVQQQRAILIAVGVACGIGAVVALLLVNSEPAVVNTQQPASKAKSPEPKTPTQSELGRQFAAGTDEPTPAVPPPHIQFGPHTVAGALDDTTEPKPAAKSGVPVHERTTGEATKDRIRSGEWKPPGTERRPVPDEAPRKAARALIDKLHHDELASATTPLKKMELADELWMEAGTEADLRPGTATGYVLFQMSVDLAAQSGDCDEAWFHLDSMDNYFAIDILAMKETALKTAAAPLFLKIPYEYERASECWIALLKEAVKEERYDDAMRFGKEAARLAQFTADTVFQSSVSRSNEHLDQLRTASALAKPSKTRASQKPDDSEAATAWGRFLCFYKNDWAEGLKLLANGAGGELVALAKRDLSNPTDAEDQVALAESWCKFATQEHDSLAMTNIRSRAVFWYRQALPSTFGLPKLALEKQLIAVLGMDSPFPLGQWVDVQTMMDTSTPAISGFWVRQRSDVGLLKASSSGRIAVPVDAQGSYDLKAEFTPNFVNGSSRVGITVPVSDRACTVLVEMSDVRLDVQTPSAEEPFAEPIKPTSNFSPAQRHTLIVHVETIADVDSVAGRVRIGVDLDGKKCIHWEAQTSLALLETGGMALSVDNAATVFHSLRFRRVSGTAEVHAAMPTEDGKGTNAASRNTTR